VEAGGGFIQQAQGAAVLPALQFRRQLDALRFAARKLRGGLAKPQVARADACNSSSRLCKAASPAKNAAASSTVIASTSAIVLSRSRMPRVAAL